MVENAFDKKTDKNSSELYFHYYAQLQHQQNMLQVHISPSHFSTLLLRQTGFSTMTQPYMSAHTVSVVISEFFTGRMFGLGGWNFL